MLACGRGALFMRKAFSTRSRGLFDPASNKPLKVSHSEIKLYLDGPRCFYLNHRHGIRRLLNTDILNKRPDCDFCGYVRARAEKKILSTC